MTETFEEDESYYIQMKTLYNRFYNSSYHVEWMKKNLTGRQKSIYFRYDDFIEIIKTMYPNNYHKNHVRYRCQCFTGIVDKNKDNMFCSKIYIKPLTRKEKRLLNIL